MGGSAGQRRLLQHALIRSFRDGIRIGGTPRMICTDNIRSLAMVFGAIDSAERGAKVAVANGI